MEEITVRFTKIIALLDSKDFWERRVEGLKLLHRTFLEDISTLGYEAAVGLLNTIRIPLKAQLEDMRSQIVKDACACVSELAKSSISDRAVWEHTSDWYISTLLTVSCNTIAIVAHAAMECLRTITTIGSVNRQALLAIANTCSHKHAVIRRNSLECLLILLHTVEVTVLQKIMSVIHKVVRTCMADPLQEGRKLARLCFWGLEKVHEDSAVILYEGLAPNVQRSIDGDKAAYEAWAANFGAVARQVQSAIKSRAPLVSPVVESTTSVRASRSSTPTSARTGKKSTQVEEGPDAYKGPATGKSNGPASVSFLTGQPMSEIIPKSSIEGRGTSPKRTSSAVLGTTRQSVVTATTRSFSNKNARATEPVVAALPHSANQMRSKSPLYSVKQPAVVKGLPMTPRVAQADESRSIYTGHSRPPTSTQPVPTVSPHETWAAIKVSAISSDWSSRSMAFVELSQLVDLNLLPPEYLVEAVGLAAGKLLDSHYRVALSATGAVARLMLKAPKDAYEHLETILNSQITNLSSQKETLRDAATVQLGSILNIFGASNLQPPLWKVIAAATAKGTRLGSLEFLLHVVQTNKVTFASPPAMKILFAKLFSFYKKFQAAEVSSDCLKAIAAIFAILYSASSEAFVSLLLRLPSEDYKMMAKACASFIPHLQQDCERVKEGQRPLRHPDPQVHSPFERRLQICSPPSPPKKDLGGLGEFSLGTDRDLGPMFGDHTSIEMEASAAKPSPPLNIRNTFDNNRSYFSPSRFSATHVSQTDMGAALLEKENNSKPTRSTATHILPKRAAEALAKLEAVPPPLQLMVDACSSPHSGDRLTAMEGAMEVLHDQPRLWSNKYKDFLAYFIAFAADPSTEVRIASLAAMSTIFTTKYLVPLCLAHLDDAFRCATININDHRPEAQQAGSHLVKVLCKGPAAEQAHRSRSVGISNVFSSPSLSTYFDPYPSSASFGGSRNDYLSNYLSSAGFMPSTSVASFANRPPAIATTATSTEPLYPLECLADSIMAVLEEGIESLHLRGQMALLKVGAELETSIISGTGGGGRLSLSMSFALPGNTPKLGMATPHLRPGEAAAPSSAGHSAAAKEATLQRFIPIIEHAMNSTHSEVRKQAVMALVDWYAAAGNALLPHLTHLTSAQLKLASIFYNRQYGSVGVGVGMVGSVDLLTEMERNGFRLRM